MKARDTANQIAKRVEDISAKQQTALTAAGADDCSAEDRTKHLATFDDLQKEKEAAQADYARWDQLARGQEWSGSPRTAPLSDAPFNPHRPSTGLHLDGDDGYGF